MDAVIILAPVAVKARVPEVAVRVTAPVPVILPTEVKAPVTFAVPLKFWPHRVLVFDNEAADPSILVIPVKDWEADALFNAIAVVPT